MDTDHQQPVVVLIITVYLSSCLYSVHCLLLIVFHTLSPVFPVSPVLLQCLNYFHLCLPCYELSG